MHVGKHRAKLHRVVLPTVVSSHRIDTNREVWHERANLLHAVGVEGRNNRIDDNAVIPQRFDVLGEVEATRFGAIVCHVGNKHSMRRRFGDRLFDLGHDSGGEDAREERAGANQHEVGHSNRVNSLTGCFGIVLLESKIRDARRSLNRDLSHKFTIIRISNKRHGGNGGRKNRADSSNKPSDFLDRCGEVAASARKSSDQQVADGMALECSTIEAMLKGLSQQAVFTCQGGQASPEIARSRQAELTTKPAG